jgi:hypothetical protein
MVCMGSVASGFAGGGGTMLVWHTRPLLGKICLVTCSYL